MDNYTRVEFNTAVHIVHWLLRHEPETRNDDELLIRRAKWIAKAHSMKTPASESITRCRRKIQAENEDLKSSADVQHNRLIRQNSVKEWSQC